MLLIVVRCLRAVSRRVPEVVRQRQVALIRKSYSSIALSQVAASLGIPEPEAAECTRCVRRLLPTTHLPCTQTRHHNDRQEQTSPPSTTVTTPLEYGAQPIALSCVVVLLLLRACGCGVAVARSSGWLPHSRAGFVCPVVADDADSGVAGAVRGLPALPLSPAHLALPSRLPRVSECVADVKALRTLTDFVLALERKPLEG